MSLKGSHHHHHRSEVFEIADGAGSQQQDSNRQNLRTTSHLLSLNIPNIWESQPQTPSATNILDLPIRLTKFMFTFIPLEDLLACMLACSAWFNVLSDENIQVWRQNCYRRLDQDVLSANYLKVCPTYKTKLRALLHSWNPYDCSPNGTVEDFLFIRNQIPQRTDGCRGKIGEINGVFKIVFEILKT